MSTVSSKLDINKFFDNNDVGLWKMNIHVKLIQQRCVEALKGETFMPARLTQTEKTEMVDKAKIVIILREVKREKTTTDMWVKFESLFMNKSLANRLCLK